MKNYVKKIAICLCFLLLLTGCVKMDFSMSIHDDKSMDLEMLTAVETSLIADKDIKELIDEERLEEMKKEGYQVEIYTDNDMTGYKIVSHFNNIDALSDENEVMADLSVNQGIEKLFQVKKGILKNTYQAKFTVQGVDDIKELLQEQQKKDKDIVTTKQYEEMLEKMNLTFQLTLPSKALSSNATTVEKDGQYLIWDVLDLNDEPIMFEFELYNRMHIYFGIAIIVLLLIVFLFRPKNKSPKELPPSQENSQNNNFQNEVPIIKYEIPDDANIGTEDSSHKSL